MGGAGAEGGAGETPRVRAWAAFVTGRRGRLVVMAAFVPLLVGGVIARSHLSEVTAAGQSSFLPASAESTEVANRLEGESSVGAEVPALIVFARDRDGGLTGADKKQIAKIGDGISRLGIAGATEVLDPFSSTFRELAGSGPEGFLVRGVGPVSKDGNAALVGLAINADEREAIQRGVRQIRDYLGHHPIAGVTAHVTGPAGIAADLERVADQAGKTLLLATTALVLLLLLIVYRAPLLAVLPLAVVGTAYAIASGLAFLMIKADLIIANSVGTLLLLVLVFGAGTDYALLLVHRYREELDRGHEPERALPLALSETAPAIAASAGTVIAAMMVLLVADLESTKWLGPILGVGVAVMLFCSLTLLPAILSLLGRRAFWPVREFSERGPSLVWLRLAGLIRRRSRPLIFAIFAILAVLSLGNLVSHGTIGFGQGETKPTDSSRGTEALNAHFPAGLGSPLTALVDQDLPDRSDRSAGEPGPGPGRGPRAAVEGQRSGGRVHRPAGRSLLR